MFSFGWILLIVDWSIRLVLAPIVIMRRGRSVQSSLAWLAVVLSLPILGLVLYLLIGETRLGSRRARRHREATSDLAVEAGRHWVSRHLNWTGGDAQYRKVSSFGQAITGIPALAGNDLELLGDSDELLKRLAADIDKAEHTCHLLFYIWQQTQRTDAIVAALIRAAERGVACRVLVDDVGSKHFLRGEQSAALKRAGVRVVAALPANPLRMLFARIDLRNHRKLAVIDSTVGYVGSQNLADTTFRSKPWWRHGPWVDATVRLTGPATLALQAVFLLDWLAETEDELEDMGEFLPDLGESERRARDDEGSAVQVFPSGPGESPFAIQQAILTALYSADDEIILTTPYFVPDDSMRLALTAAARRGVRVTLILPRHSDSPLVLAAGRSNYSELMNAGVRIMEHQTGLLHAKTLTIDRRLALIGSANLDVRSFLLNFEISLFVFDSEFASILRFLQSSYLNDSKEVSFERWRKRPLHRKVLENSAHLLGPLL